MNNNFKKNILFISDFDRGGIESRLITEAEALKKYGYRIVNLGSINILPGEGKSRKEWEGLNLPYYKLPIHRGIFLFFLPISVILALRIIKKENIDIIHCNHFTSAFFASILNKFTNLPIVYSVHGINRLQFPPAVFPKWSLRRISKIIVSSEGAESFLLKNKFSFPKSNIEILRNEIDATKFFYLDKKQKKGYLDKGNYFNITCITRLDRDKIKGVRACLEAVSLIYKVYPKIKFLIVGDGRKFKSIKNLSLKVNKKIGKDIIEVYGWPENLVDVFKETDLVLGMGRVALESMSAGVPVFIVGEEKIEDLVSEKTYKNIRRYNFSGRTSNKLAKPENIAEEIINLIKNPGLLESARKFCREAVLQDYDIKILVKKLINIYNSVE